MNTPLKSLVIFFGVLFWASTHSLAIAATFYVSPTGNNANPGTMSQPFATLQKAHDVAFPGDIIYMRGGTYALSTQTVITKSGSSGNPIKVFNYEGEVPILDGSTNSGSPGHSIIRVNNGVSWWHFKGLEVRNSPGYGFYLVGNTSNISIENCNVHHNLRLDNSGGGINAEYGSNLVFLNNDLHHNGHIPSEGGSGIALSNSKGTGNVIRGNRMWRNNDNGLALWDAANVLVENNWVWENGYDDQLNPSTPGDGVGLKLGGSGGGDGNHVVRNNIVWRNAGNGIDQNGADLPITVYNNTSYENVGSNFNFHTVAHVLKNNLAVPKGSHLNVLSPVAHTFNSWNLTVTVSSADFVSLDFSGAAGPRNADGSLPTINFLRLAPGSDLIDKGTNVGFAFTGTVPDLGAYEYNNSVVLLQPPSSLVVQ